MNATPGAQAMTDEEVVRRVLAGETSLFEILMRRYNQRLFRATRSILGDDEESQDAVQEAYLNAYLSLSRFEGRAKFSTWLTRIAINEALARSRVRGKFVEIESVSGGEEEYMASQRLNPEEEANLRALGRVLESAIDRLPQAYRSVFMLRDVEGMSTAETAECLGMSEDAVKVRLHRARALMRKEIYQQTGAASASAFVFLGARCDLMVARVMKRIESLKLN
jgi:RNA polymerase sigma-70 factor (ECF subfamily)